jgi:hypothetical protein
VPASSSPDALARACSLLAEAQGAFLAGDQAQARRTRTDADGLIAAIAAGEDRALAQGGRNGSEGWPDLACADSLAQAALHVAILAEGRPPSRVPGAPGRALEDLTRPLGGLLHGLQRPDGDAAHAPQHLAAVQAARNELVRACMQVASSVPRSFASCLVALAAGRHLEDAAEAACVAAQRRGNLVVA